MNPTPPKHVHTQLENNNDERPINETVIDFCERRRVSISTTTHPPPAIPPSPHTDPNHTDVTHDVKLHADTLTPHPTTPTRTRLPNTFPEHFTNAELRIHTPPQVEPHTTPPSQNDVDENDQPVSITELDPEIFTITPFPASDIPSPFGPDSSACDSPHPQISECLTSVSVFSKHDSGRTIVVF
ncbi:hypothetical protein BLNAU_19677 [Blattamonas nauphoetae]|uniref:Uncharacterized protein n=1 Tax=Blattamonas nauphoetae TaxID=2049346 RepID=A0ABQ9X1E2_9EUKA|nr:hypothetical protein BLNAU_19677 [Blattamonas nauphoetae]